MNRRIARPVARRAPIALALTAATLAACADGEPVGPARSALPVPATALQAFDCHATTAGTFGCRPAGAGSGDAGRVILGGQDQFLRLASQNPSYDAGTGIFEVEVTVQNLLSEAIGTPDGAVPATNGIRVFFAQGPSVVTGSGTVTVDNADGTDLFLAANQPYFRYSEILTSDQVSAPKPWRFAAPATVESFSFRVYVETEVQYLLVINEVLANPGGTITDIDGEWFELYNAGTLPVELQNLVIADSAASGRRPYHLIVNSVVIAPGGYAVLGNNANMTLNGGVALDYSYGQAMALANSLDAIKIARVYGTDTLTLDRTQYSSAAVSAQNGISRELTNPGLDNSNMDGSNWANASVTAVYGPGGRGTPGAQNSTFAP